MSRRREQRFYEPKPTTVPERTPPELAPPPTFRDAKGREWTAHYLSRDEDRYYRGVRPWDATHRGFVCGKHQRIYPLSGADRDLSLDTLRNQLAMSTRISTPEERAARAGKGKTPTVKSSSMADRIQERSGGRRMGRR